MNKKLLLSSCACISFFGIFASEKDEISMLAKKYAVLSQLRQNAVNIQLIIAARMRKDRAFFVNLVKSQGAQINAIDFQGKTALIHAIILRDYEAVQALLELGASKALKDSFGKTAREYAYENNDTQMVDLLDSFGQTRNLR